MNTLPVPADLRRWLNVDFSDEQLVAATAPLEPGLIVAGAGTGKTTVMAARVTWLVATGAVAPEHVLGLTFTTKATAEFAARVRASLTTVRSQVAGDSDEHGDPTVSTYHSFASRLIGEHGTLVGAEPGARMVSDAALKQLAYRVVCRSTIEFEGPPTTPFDMVDKLLTLESALTEHAVDPDALRSSDARLIEWLLGTKLQNIGRDMIQTAQRRRDLAALVDELRAEKQRLFVMDFSDQLRLALTAAQRYPQVSDDLRDRFRVVLLDEYQDTSVTQRLLMQTLFGNGHPVTAVGDPFQAIYEWRGASVVNIDRFPEHFPVVADDGTSKPATVYPLTTNRRSRQPILDVANAVAQPLRALHSEAGLLVAGQTSRPPAPTASIVCAMLSTELDEFAWIADRVVEVNEAGHPWSDITVLMRALSRVGLLRDALVLRGVPVEIVGVEGLLSLPEVVEVLSVLELLHDPTANAACTRLLAGPRWRIGPRDLRLLGERAADLAGRFNRYERQAIDDALDAAVAGSDPADLVCLVDALDDLGDAPLSDEAGERMMKLANELRVLRRYVGEPLGDLVDRVLDVTGFRAELMADGGAVAAQRLAAVGAFQTLASEFRDLDGRATLSGLLQFVRDARKFKEDPEADLPNPGDSVRIMSVHKSKGLEFPVVVLPCLDDRTFPSSRGRGVWTTAPDALPYSVRREPEPAGLPPFPVGDEARSVDHGRYKEGVRELALLEERRLAYVAITRAETTLIASASYWTATRTTSRSPGEFLDTIRSCCEGGLGTVAVWADPPGDEPNPLVGADPVQWPTPLDPADLNRRRSAAALVQSLRGVVTAESLTDEGDERVASWDRDLAVLLAEAERDHALERSVRLPETLSTTSMQLLFSDEQAFLRSLVRPMPQRPSPAARRGTRFHAWVESLWGEQPLLEPDDLPGAADADIDSDADLEAMQATFLAMTYASMRPWAMEEQFALLLGGRLIPGRIDAVFRHADPSGDAALDRWEVVDWKTNREASADPIQLAVYRVAWAERLGIAIDRVDATFVYVRLGEVRRYGAGPECQPLPDRTELERMLAGE